MRTVKPKKRDTQDVHAVILLLISMCCVILPVILKETTMHQKAVCQLRNKTEKSAYGRFCWLAERSFTVADVTVMVTFGGGGGRRLGLFHYVIDHTCSSRDKR